MYDVYTFYICIGKEVWTLNHHFTCNALVISPFLLFWWHPYFPCEQPFLFPLLFSLITIFFFVFFPTLFTLTLAPWYYCVLLHFTPWLLSCSLLLLSLTVSNGSVWTKLYRETAAWRFKRFGFKSWKPHLNSLMVFKNFFLKQSFHFQALLSHFNKIFKI